MALENPPGSAFLLAAVGAHAAARFAERVAELDLTPPQIGLLGLIAASPGQSQQAVAHVLGMPPSRLVGLVDALADRGLVERRRNPTDRRLHALHITDAGQAALGKIATIGREHDDALCRSLDSSERETLRTFLSRIAADQGLRPGIHPGYRTV
ncbi:MarR family winged helix-turn-helix transcriptional regulator [Pseudonocardia adelaidensis]|uniref:HTH marR-type domain-containing protein n=1 Tax=Pseudonocardia adelaidensis TaxID=648754 RepID=A0ABP9NI39_9PSEU